MIGPSSMRMIHTATEDLDALAPWDRDQVYNGLDVLVTHDVHSAIEPMLDPTTRATYQRSLALQGPVLEMKLRGCKIDLQRRVEVIDLFFEKSQIIEAQLDRIVLDGVGLNGFNWRSPHSVRRLLFDELGLPKGRDGTVDRAAREHLEVYPIAEQIIKHINVLADLGKKISALRMGVDPDGRIRTSYNIAGTNTGRFSSSESEFGTGGNLQNIEEALRSIFVADPGMKFAKFDAKSGESFCVGALEWNLFNDPLYLDACESGDPHTAVARICWPGLPWTGDLSRDKVIAEQPFYRHYSYRFMCKKLGHGSNYGGKPHTLSEQSKLAEHLVADFQPKYFAAFPAHQRWQRWVDLQLRTKGHLVSLMGRRRWFHKRRSDPKALREAIAYDPQSSLADIVNTALLSIWRLNIATLMFQDHDALTFMYPEAREAEVIAEIQRHLIVDVPLAQGRVLRIPYDCKTGWNKGDYDKDNPDRNPEGLKDFHGSDSRRRARPINILDRRPKKTH